ncbi:MAG TPA: DUF507 family protein [Nitrospirales bacterium]|nr:DUF507 family protein [Nitrospirales bacterium]
MKLSKERVASLAASLVDTLTAGGMIEPVGDRKTLIGSLERIITDELSVEDRINAEAKELMRKYEAEIAKGHLNEHQVFLMIKKQLVKEKGAIL